MKVLLSTEATGGAISVRARHKPGEGSPDRVHFNQEEMFFIIEGSCELTVDNETSKAGPGTSSSSRGTWCAASRTSATRRRSYSTGDWQVDRTTTPKDDRNSKPAAEDRSTRRYKAAPLNEIKSGEDIL
jgi:uncharacterized cupin superfamily protein